MMTTIRNFAWLLAAQFIFATTFAADSYVNFESHQFRPVVLSPSGERLFVANTPDNRVEIFDLSGDQPRHIAEVMVGLEPVAIGVRNDDEIWVVNHLSDSVSVVDVSAMPPRVTRTLLVGDEPRDIVFAGPENQRAFITTAHRGQNSPYRNINNPGELATPGIGRADVWVFDSAAPGDGLGGHPLAVVAMFGDSPGPLAVSPDGKSVYVAVFKSGNQTTIVGRVLICPGGIEVESCETLAGGPVAPGGLPPPNETAAGVPMPEAGLIVKWDGEGWKDELGRDWSSVIRLDLPDYDVFELDALATPPSQKNAYPGVGTVLYAMAVNPADSQVYVANTDAINEVRFEGVREPDSDITTVLGHLHETRITVINPADVGVAPVHLNPHIDYDVSPAPEAVREKSLSMPVAIEFTKDGKTAYVAAKGSDKVAVIKTSTLRPGRFKPKTKQHIALPGGPSGLALDEPRRRLYVLTRFDNALHVVDTKKRKILYSQTLYSPEPSSVTAGRPLFYNAFLTSGNGESSCASCHVAGDKDELAWDLGDPFGEMMDNPSEVLGPLKGNPKFHPMKGPMLTQTMRGVANHGPLHWRGDRTAGNDPGGDPLDTAGGMNKFNAAFVSLMGREDSLSPAEMQILTDFSMQIMPPPNPIRRLNNSLTPMQAEGKAFFERAPSVPGRQTCTVCHSLNPRRGWYGTRGTLTHIIGGRLTKVPHHRNTYERVGMFGRAPSRSLPGNGEHMGAQIRGYGFTHDGGADTTIRFMSYPVFVFPKGNQQRRAVEQYLFAYESNLKPVVGQQITAYGGDNPRTKQMIDLLYTRALAGDADLVARTIIDGRARGYLLQRDGKFLADSQGEVPVSLESLLEAAYELEQPLTFTAVPPGSGQRIALDRNSDGTLDGDEEKQRMVSDH